MTGRIGGWMRTASGRRFRPLDPMPEEVWIGDIAAALAKVCRFGGHCAEFYSVAQHSVLVSHAAEDMAPESEKRLAAMWGLMHDAAEAYIPDVVRPIKGHLLGLERIERDLLQAIATAVGLPWPPPAPWWRWVEIADDALLATEARDLMGDPRDWILAQAPIPSIRIVPLPPGEAEQLFLERFAVLFGRQEDDA